MLEASHAFVLGIYETREAIWEITYVGRVDAIVNDLDRKEIWVMDHKTHSTKAKNWLAQYSYPNNQMCGYTFSASLLLNQHVHGVIVNLIHTTKYRVDFDRGWVRYTRDELAEWLKNIRAISYKIIDDTESGRFIRHAQSCYGKYGRCAYHEICNSPHKVREAVIRQDYEENEWTPLGYRGD